MGESAWAASGEMHTAVAGMAGPRFMVQSLQTASRALCCSYCTAWAEGGVSGKHCFWYSDKHLEYNPRTVSLHLYNPMLKHHPAMNQYTLLKKNESASQWLEGSAFTADFEKKQQPHVGAF